MYLGEYRIDDYITIVAATHRFSSGAAYAPTSITYRVYEDATSTEIVSDTAMTNFDSVTGFYLDRIQATAALGYEVGKTYTVLIQATVDSVAAIDYRTFRILTPPVNMTQLDGAALSTHASGMIPADVRDIAGAAVSTSSAQLGVNVVSNGDKTGYALSTAGNEATADALLGRNVAGGSNTGRIVKEALYPLRNKWGVNAGTYTVYQTDDTTVSWTAPVSSDGSAQPITGVDPA